MGLRILGLHYAKGQSEQADLDFIPAYFSKVLWRCVNRKVGLTMRETYTNEVTYFAPIHIFVAVENVESQNKFRFIILAVF